MSVDKTIERIVVLMAMADEAQPVIDDLGLLPVEVKESSALPFQYYQSTSHSNIAKDISVTLMTSGIDPRHKVDNIGTQAATLMAHTAIDQFAPDILFNAGTAGGFSSRGAEVGTVYLSDTEFVFHDRRVPLEGFSESGVGHYPALNVRGLAAELNLPVGIVSTGSSLQKSELDISVIEEHQAVAKEMEAAAIAWVCWLHQQPLVAVKSITNLLDEGETSETQFLKNLSLASRCLSTQLQKVILSCSNRTLSSLSGE